MWLDAFHDEMAQVCEKRRAETSGECEFEDCLGLGWCAQCLSVAIEKGHDMTQGDKILRYLEQYESISPMEAFSELGITKLATRISELKREGVEFNQRYESRVNRFGEQVHYMRYWLKK